MLTWLKSASKAKNHTPAPTEPSPFAAEAPQILAEGTQFAAVGRNRRVLVVDDDPVVLKAFELKLQANGFTVFTATDAATVAGTAQKVKPELILLDINFPATSTSMEWSGLTAIQWLRRFPELAAIPVIVISSSESIVWKDKAMRSGAIGFFQKPVAFKELLNAMLQALGIQQG